MSGKSKPPAPQPQPKKDAKPAPYFTDYASI